MKVHALLSKRGRSMIAIGAVATAIAINGLGSASAGAANPPAVPNCETALTTETQTGSVTNGVPASPGTGAGTVESGTTADDSGTAQLCAVGIVGSSAPTVSVSVCISNGVTTQSFPAFEVVPDQSGEGTPAAGGAGTAPESGTSNAGDASASATAGGTDAATSAEPNAGGQPSSAANTTGGDSYATQDGGVTTTVIAQDSTTGAPDSQTVPAETGSVVYFSPAVTASETQQTCISISIGAGGAIEIVPLIPGVNLPSGNGEAPANQGTSTGGAVTIPAQPGAGAPSTTQPGQTAPQQQVPDSTPVPTR